jgi:hypothetical protein
MGLSCSGIALGPTDTTDATAADGLSRPDDQGPSTMHLPGARVEGLYYVQW